MRQIAVAKKGSVVVEARGADGLVKGGVLVRDVAGYVVRAKPGAGEPRPLSEPKGALPQVELLVPGVGYITVLADRVVDPRTGTRPWWTWEGR